MTDPLTDREREILTLLGEGLEAEQIAERLSISVNTVKMHKRNIFEKTGTRNTVSALRAFYDLVPREQ